LKIGAKELQFTNCEKEKVKESFEQVALVDVL